MKKGLCIIKGICSAITFASAVSTLAFIGIGASNSKKVDKFVFSSEVEAYRVEKIDDLNERYSKGEIDEAVHQRESQGILKASKEEVADFYFATNEDYIKVKSAKDKAEQGKEISFDIFALSLAVNVLTSDRIIKKKDEEIEAGM